jgi:hypothetical protein
MGEFWSYFYVCQTACDVDCDQRSDVGDCEAVAGDELMSVQLAIHPFEALIHGGTLGIGARHGEACKARFFRLTIQLSRMNPDHSLCL